MLKCIRIGILAGLAITSAAHAQQKPDPIIAGYGLLNPATDVANLPDPSVRYRVVFEVTRDGGTTDKVNPALDRLARFLNLLGASGIRPASGDLVAVIHGPATFAILSDAEYRKRFGKPNPNTALLKELRGAGVSIHVCSYALANQKIERQSVAEGVDVDLAAMMTIATLQLKGWALISA